MTEQDKNPSAVALGKLGRAVMSDAQADTSRSNGKFGGRPRLTAAERRAREAMRKKRARKKSLKARKCNRRRK